MAYEAILKRLGFIPRRVSAESPQHKEEIGQTFYSLVRSVTSRYPRLVLDNQKELPELKLLEVEKKMVGFLNKNTSPQQIVKIIFDNPPSVYATMDADPENTFIPIKPPQKIVIVEPPRQDIETADRKITIPGNIGEFQAQALALIVKTCRNYLKAPKILDGFSEKDINRRSLWVLGVSTVLHQLTIDSTNETRSHKPRYDWATYFEDIWNYNRYAGTRRNAVYMNLPLITMMEFPPEIKESVRLILGELEQTKYIFASGNVDEATDIIAAECAKVLALFSN